MGRMSEEAQGILKAELLERRRSTADDGEGEEEISMRQRLIVENKKLWVVAGPSIMTRFTSFGVIVVTQAFIGHIGATELAGFSIVSTVITRFANGILLGMASALETLCGQSFGAKQYPMLGVYLQRSWIILNVCAVFLLPLFIFTTPLLILFKQDEQIAEMAGTISLWYIPIVFSFVFQFTLQMYLQAQSRNSIIMYLAIITFVFHIALSWLLVQTLSLGLAGAMISLVTSMWLPVVGQLAFIFLGGCPDTWKGFTWIAFKDLGKIIKLSLSSGLMLCLELWYNTVLVFLTGYMKNAEIALDALSICLNINGWELMISLGFLGAAGVRIANELGAGSSKKAKFAVVNVVTQSAIVGVILFVIFLFLQGSIAYLFTENAEVASAVAKLSPLLAISILLNSVQPVLSGVAVGAGWQGLVAYVNLGCYYLIGIPLGMILAYIIRLSVTGIWSGMLFGTLMQTLVLIYITVKTDWEKQVAKARERINQFSETRSVHDSSNGQQTA